MNNFVSSIWGWKWKVFLWMSCQKFSQIYHTTSRKCLNRAHEELASLCVSLIFIGILVRVAFLTNMCIASDHTSEVVNVKYSSELHARSGLRFTTRLQEDSWIVPTRALGWATDPRKNGHPREGWIPCSLELLTMSTYEKTVWWCKTWGGSQLCIADKKTSRAAIDRSISGSKIFEYPDGQYIRHNF